MRVQFFGLQESMKSWREIVITTTNKPCEPIALNRDKYLIDNYSFIAHIDESDCDKLMAHWYVTESGHKWAWNCRVSFDKL
jgi:hypothetical protein